MDDEEGGCRVKKIYKYDVEVNDTFEVEMPDGAEILTVQVQHQQPVIWALVETNNKTVKRFFRLIGTGNPIEMDEQESLNHIGTFQITGGALVFHLFERHQMIFG
jgi:hypothetical protein